MKTARGVLLPPEHIEKGIFVAIFLAFTLGVLGAGYFLFQNYEKNYLAQVERELDSIAELKVSELTDYVRERRDDAGMIFGNGAFSMVTARFLRNKGDVEAERILRVWMGKFTMLYHYNRTMLLDSRGEMRLSVPETPESVSDEVLRHIPEILRAPKVTLEDFFRHEDTGRIYLDVLAPILDPKEGNRVIGILVLRIDPEKYLYPFISRWPINRKTAETLLVRRDGNEVLFLNELRFQKNTALTLHFPLDGKSSLPAARAVLGEEGVIRGLDYRGVPSIASLRAIKGTPWFIVARMDISEAFSRQREILWLMGTLIITLIAGAGAGTAYLGRRKEARVNVLKYEAAEALLASEEKFRTLFQAMTEGVAIHEMVYDQKGKAVDYRIIDINPAYRKHTGLGEVGETAKLATELYGVNAPPYLEEYARVASTGEPYAFEAYFEPLGKHFSVAVVSPRRGQFATVFEDITDRLRQERELKERNEELARFTYTVSHDLKSPLVTVKTFLGFLEKDMRGQHGERVEKDLEYIHGAADKMTRLLDELLELSRVGRKMNPPEEAALRDIVRDALSLVAGRIIERGARVEVTEEPVMLYGDRPRMVELFQNLVDNAVKFMGDQSDPAVEIGIEREGEEIIIFVRDNGIGIDPRHRSKLFGLFEKLNPGLEGTGIGLALVKRIVEVHGGRIWAESAGIGKGAEFRFTMDKTKLRGN